MKKILAIILLGCAVHSLNAQSLVYNLVQKSTSVGKYSSSGTTKGYVLMVPFSGSDGKWHFSEVSFYTFQYKKAKDFYYSESVASDDGYGYIEGGYIFAIVKIGKVKSIIATPDGSYDSATISGAATYGPISGTTTFGYYAKSLTSSHSGYGQDYEENNELGATDSEYQLAYKYSFVNSYTLNAALTKMIVNSSYDDAKNYLINYLEFSGYTNRTDNPY